MKLAHDYLVVELNHSAIQMFIETPPTSPILTDWLQFGRNVLSKSLIAEIGNTKIGGPGKTIVIDETALGRRK